MSYSISSRQVGQSSRSRETGARLHGYTTTEIGGVSRRVYAQVASLPPVVSLPSELTVYTVLSAEGYCTAGEYCITRILPSILSER
jgi:hypothetical protein